MKNLSIIAIMVITILLIFIAADYLSLFGVREKLKSDFIEINFKVIDEKTGAPVTGTHVRCFQMNNRNACSQREASKSGIVSINIPVTRITTRSFLFIHDEKIQETRDPKIHVMFIHPDYANPVETIYIEDFPDIAGEVITVTMPEPFSNSQTR